VLVPTCAPPRALWRRTRNDVALSFMFMTRRTIRASWPVVVAFTCSAMIACTRPDAGALPQADPTQGTAAGSPADSARLDSGRTRIAGGDVVTADTQGGNRGGAARGAGARGATDSTGKPAKPAPLPVNLLAVRTHRDTFSLRAAIRAGLKRIDTWPKGPTPAPGAIMPAKRIVAYYGNPLSKKMGVLGEYPVDEMLAKLDKEVAAWNAADPSTPVQPALHLVTVVAQGDPGRDGKYRLRMDTALINKVLGWAERKNALLFLDIQVAKSTVQEEIPRLLPYLMKPNVHLGLDPEFSMHYDKEGVAPGKKIGTMDAADINYAIRTLAKISADNKLPPKVLVVHRFTRPMVRNYQQIALDPHVQVVMNMDGWGQPWLKFDSYQAYEVTEPVQFTGFKIFYGNDSKKGDTVLTPAEVLNLVPRPMYIQYQ
jgi:hypothetical protein